MIVQKYIWYYLTYFALLCSFPLHNCARSFKITLLNCSTTDSLEFVKTGCEIVVLNNKTTMNYHIQTKKDVNKMQSNVTLAFQREKHDYFTLLDISFDFCKLLEAGTSQNVLNIFHEMMEKYGNFPKGCPFIAGQNYSINNMYIDADLLPPYTPDGIFRYETRTKVDNYKSFISFVVYSKVESKRPKVLSKFL